MQLLQSRALPLGYPAFRSAILPTELARLKTKMIGLGFRHGAVWFVCAWFQVGSNYNFLMKSSSRALFSGSKSVVAMIHLGALPGTPANRSSLADIEKLALREAKIFRAAGVQGLMLENMHDTPYLRNQVGPEIVAAMAIIARAVKELSQLPCGIQILAGANIEALAVAHETVTGGQIS